MTSSPPKSLAFGGNPSGNFSVVSGQKLPAMNLSRAGSNTATLATCESAELLPAHTEWFANSKAATTIRIF